MRESAIEVSENTVRVRDLVVTRRAVAEFVRQAPDEEREAAVTRALEVGVFCLERASDARDIDFVRHQMDGLLHAIETAMHALPSQLENALLARSEPPMVRSSPL